MTPEDLTFAGVALDCSPGRLLRPDVLLLVGLQVAGSVKM